MATLRVAPRTKPPVGVGETSAEDLHARLDAGALRLRAIAIALRLLGDRDDDEEAQVLPLLARDIDLEADAMSAAEAFLYHASLTKGAA